MLYPYLIRYVSGRTLQPCFDTQLAANNAAAVAEHLKRFPKSRDIAVKSRRGVWLRVKNTAVEGIES